MAIRKVISRSIGTDVIVAEDLAANSITVSELSDNAVTNAKLHEDVHRGGRKNLIINGAMQVAQRGTSFSLAHDGNRSGYGADRFIFIIGGNCDTLDGTVEQVSDAPDGFSKSLKWTTGTAETIDANDVVYIQKKIEGQDVQHLDYGGSGAKQLTLSFYVKSSVTGTFNTVLYLDDDDRSITSTYTINSADTWEQKTITFVGDQTGVIDDNNGEGLRVAWNIASGSDYTSADSSSWGAHVVTRWAYGHAQNGVVTTAGETFQLTGVQLEVGDTTTPFEHRSYAEELTLCMRYYQRHDHRYYFRVRNDSRGSQNPDWAIPITYPHPMRSVPTVNTFTDSNFTTSGYTSTGGSDMQMQIDKWGMYVTGNSNNSGAGAVGALWWMELVAEL